MAAGAIAAAAAGGGVGAESAATAAGGDREAAGVGGVGGLDSYAPSRPLVRQGRLDDRTTNQRQADTLVGLVTTAMGLPDAPKVAGNPGGVIITITQAELDEHARSGRGLARIEHTGDVVPAQVAAKLICDGHTQAVLIDDAGLPLKLGRTQRLHTRAQRRAILTGYPGGCANPRCSAPPGFTEIHHPVPWAQGGATDTSNGIPVCQHCHGELHAGRLVCANDHTTGRWTIQIGYGLNPTPARAWGSPLSRTGTPTLPNYNTYHYPAA